LQDGFAVTSTSPPITLCGSLSQVPVSLGASMHQAGYRALGLPFSYVPFKVEDLAGALTGMRALGIRGFGISMPFKQAVMALCDEIDPVAARIGAVNTVVNDAGRLSGHNTDWIGAVRAIEEYARPAGLRVLVIGAGGAARAVVHGLVSTGAAVTIANRDEAKAVALAADANATAASSDEPARAGDYDIVVNASSRGMKEIDPTSPVPAGVLRAGQLVMDIVYKPLDTQLVLAARAAGARVIDGSRMLLHQAARQFELYTGRQAPLDAMSAALAAAIDPSRRPAAGPGGGDQP
jgi:shikimate dehydrogenase